MKLEAATSDPKMPVHQKHKPLINMRFNFITQTLVSACSAYFSTGKKFLQGQKQQFANIG
jgi:hypothetical protein